jgi:hypothetical protein
LPRGAVFETIDGTRAVKSEYGYDNGGCECILLASGEYAHFGKTPRAHNAMLVRPLAVVSSSVVTREDTPEIAAARAAIIEAERDAATALTDGEWDDFAAKDSEVNVLRSDLWKLRHPEGQSR